ncbi:glycosyltransferase involved in cell wall biosynthesis [Melghirimyces profundicolus]|uniref:Glycosyltransferase involved in cell wall biosynthesis n=1 Tax=Melghirimyces profundicolus TaxID=1242148 RepID=A0A2T6BWD5_9BACL|nr:glycosyltransferase family 2 protein [Melghirimyces profundicolus]PTX60336.1 glycosyltransferase involved in cell wall biosynthesis [Melghirimyces profundicolus]
MTFPMIPNRVSIVVPCYNREKYLNQCLSSLINQTYSNIEIIIVDDNSTDQSVPKIQSWIRSLPTRQQQNIVFLSLPRNTGNAGAYTTGMFLARGEFIALQDSDDYSHPRRIEKQVEFLRKHPKVGLAGTQYAWFREENGKRFPAPNWLRYGEEIKKSYQKGKHCVCVATSMFRRSLFDHHGGFHRGINRIEDYKFMIKFFKNGATIENIPEILYYYRAHPDQRSRKNRKRQ